MSLIFSSIGASSGYVNSKLDGSSAAPTTASASAVAPSPPRLERRVDLGRECAVLERELSHELQLLVGIGREPVHGDDRLQAEAVDDPDVAREVRRAGLDRVCASVGIARVVLERTQRRDEHDRARTQVADAAGDVEELLHAHVRGEAGLRDDARRRASGRRGRRRASCCRARCSRTGPQCTNAGWPSSVCTRFGLIASLRSTASEPAARICSAVTGSPSYVCPIVIAPSRSRRSARSRATATRPMISLAAVMSKPVCRG